MQLFGFVGLHNTTRFVCMPLRAERNFCVQEGLKETETLTVVHEVMSTEEKLPPVGS